MFCPSVPPSARMQRRRRDRVTALGQRLHARRQDLFLHLNARRQPKIVMPSVAGDAPDRLRQQAKALLQLRARPTPAVARVDVDDDHAARGPHRDADVEVGRRPHKLLEGLEVVRRVVHAVRGHGILAGSIDAQLGWRERHDLEVEGHQVLRPGDHVRGRAVLQRGRGGPMVSGGCAAKALSRQTSIGHCRRQIRPSASVIHEQKQWSSAPP